MFFDTTNHPVQPTPGACRLSRPLYLIGPSNLPTYYHRIKCRYSFVLYTQWIKVTIPRKGCALIRILWVTEHVSKVLKNHYPVDSNRPLLACAIKVSGDFAWPSKVIACQKNLLVKLNRWLNAPVSFLEYSEQILQNLRFFAMHVKLLLYLTWKLSSVL